MFSPSAMAFASWITASGAYLPSDVSHVKIKASAPSRTADVISSASCRVHYSLLTIYSRIWLSKKTGLPSDAVLSIIHFWASITFSGGSSRPSSALLSIIPSAALIISSKLWSPSSVFILAIIYIWLPAGPKTSLTCWISFFLRA